MTRMTHWIPWTRRTPRIRPRPSGVPTAADRRAGLGRPVPRGLLDDQPDARGVSGRRYGGRAEPVVRLSLQRRHDGAPDRPVRRNGPPLAYQADDDGLAGDGRDLDGPDQPHGGLGDPRPHARQGSLPRP